VDVLQVEDAMAVVRRQNLPPDVVEATEERVRLVCDRCEMCIIA
jgi:hypothetical protein